MTKIRISLMVLFAAILFSGCSRNCEESATTTYFSTKTGAESGLLELYLDGIYKGDLPLVQKLPECGEREPLSSMLSAELDAHTYKVEMKDKQGVVHYSGTLEINTKKLHGTTYKGGMESRRCNDSHFVTVQLWK